MRPLCRMCSVVTDCNNRATATTPTSDGTRCACACRNQWTGGSCATCPACYGGADCDRCAPGLINYPACTNQNVNITALKLQCAATCTKVLCTGSKLTPIGASYRCECLNCQMPRRTCEAEDNVPCSYPPYACINNLTKPICYVKGGSTGTKLVQVACKWCV